MTRRGWITMTCFAIAGIGVSALFHPAPALIWNASASVPIGLYAVLPARALHVAHLVVARPPEPLATYLDERRYLPRGVPLLKHVAALQGHAVCRTNRIIAVDGQAVGLALSHDQRGRPLPVWRGCRVVATAQLFLMNRRPDSLDGRYFGPLPVTTIVGRAEPRWTDGAVIMAHARTRQTNSPHLFRSIDFLISVVAPLRDDDRRSRIVRRNDQACAVESSSR